MHRLAIFVDAGYLFAQGSTAIGGSKKARSDISIDAPAAITELKEIAKLKAPTASLLRIYWYDGATGGLRLTGDQALLANLDDVKVRLGFVNSRGQQKGVDSLIVTDLIELARQKAIHDAVLLSGDEDVRVGVQIAQNYGVRIHLLGISPSRGSQSVQLMQEADTTHEWKRETIAKFLSIRPSPATTAVAAPVTEITVTEIATPTRRETAVRATVVQPETDAPLKDCAKSFVDSLGQNELENLQAYWKTDRGVPPELDRRLLPQGRTAIGRDLDQSEKRLIRSEFQRLMKQKIASLEK